MEQFYRDFEHLRDHFTPPFSSRALFSRSFLRALKMMMMKPL
jgi:hypothetical protein